MVDELNAVMLIITATKYFLQGWPKDARWTGRFVHAIRTVPNVIALCVGRIVTTVGPMFTVRLIILHILVGEQTVIDAMITQLLE